MEKLRDQGLRTWLGLPLLLGLFVFGCAQKEVREEAFQEGDQEKSVRSTNEYQMAAVVWFQNAAETRALQLMAYNTAKWRLQEEIAAHKKKGKGKKRLAVVLDIDETVLDNSSYQANNILKDQSFPAGWTDWVNLRKARVIPGAKEFLKFADSQGVEVIYITNRKLVEEEATLENLKALGLPIRKGNLLVRTGPSGKEDRRKKVAQDYEVVLLVGDNLNDFSQVFEEKNVEERMAEADKWGDEFGKRWIVLPNPMYGDWEGAIYDYNWKKTEDEKNMSRRNSLQTFGYEQE